MTVRKERAPRNRTLDLTPEERECFLAELHHELPNGRNHEWFDCIVNADLMEIKGKLPKNAVDLLILDPPYNIDKNFGGLSFRRLSDVDYAAYIETWLPSVLDTLKPTASVYFCCDWMSSPVVYEVLSRHLVVRNRITWQREKGRGAMGNWKNCSEDIWYASKTGQYYFDVNAVKQKRRVLAPYRENGNPKDWENTEEGQFRLTFPSNFWDDISIPYWSMPENTDHPTQKAEKLLAKLILASSREGDVIFDPFLGSGTSAVVAKKLNRRYLGVEINAEYCCWALKRLCQAEKDKTIQGYVDGVFWERNTLNFQKKASRVSGARQFGIQQDLFG